MKTTTCVNSIHLPTDNPNYNAIQKKNLLGSSETKYITHSSSCRRKNEENIRGGRDLSYIYIDTYINCYKLQNKTVRKRASLYKHQS